MLSSFLVFTSSILQKCEANLTKVPDPPNSSYVLKHISILTRHGARSPLNTYVLKDFSGAWICDSPDSPASRIEAIPMDHPRHYHRIIDQRVTEFSPNCRRGELILEGQDQHYRLGSTYKSYLIDSLKFLDEKLHPSNIYIRASSYDRTYRSAVSFLSGLYPPKTENELIDIITGVPNSDVLRPNKLFCKNITDLYAIYLSSEQCQKDVEEAKIVLKPFCDYIKADCDKLTQSTADRYCDYLNTMKCTERQLPSDLNDNLFDFCMRYQGNQLFNLYGFNDTFRTYGGSYTLREIFRVLDSHINGETTAKFALFSAHDSTVAAVLAALKFDYSKLLTIPPLASHLTMEVYEKENELYCRWVFNGDVINLPLVDDLLGKIPDGYIYSLNDFYQVYRPRVNKQVVCPEMP